MFKELKPLKARKLVADFRAGSSEAFTKLHVRFSRPILRYVSGRISDLETAEEITQEIFLKAFRFRESYQERYAFSTWLWTIARNTVSDHLRSGKTEDPLSEPAQIEDMACDRPCAETSAIRKDQFRSLLKSLQPLTRLQKRVVWMRAIHQLSYEEISCKLGLSISAVKNLAYRAKLTLTDGFALSPSLARP